MANDAAVKRPRSVWILTIGNGVLAAFLVAASLKAEDRGFTSGQAALYGVFGLAITIAAFSTWCGHRWGRIVLLALLTISLGEMVIWSAMVLNISEETGYHGALANQALTHAIGAIGWLALNWFLLFGKKTRMFFK